VAGKSGLAAGITPLIFTIYLLITRRTRATATFATRMAAGFVLLAQPRAHTGQIGAHHRGGAVAPRRPPVTATRRAFSLALSITQRDAVDRSARGRPRTGPV
jgi:hypothetical protein